MMGFIERLMHYAVMGALSIVVAVTAFLIIFYLSGFHGGNHRYSKQLRYLVRYYASKNDEDQKRIAKLANDATARSYVKFGPGKVTMVVPAKPYYKMYPNGEVKKLIRQQILSEEFADFLESEFPTYYFSSWANKGDCFVLIGEC